MAFLSLSACSARDPGDFDGRERLPVALLAVVVLAAPELEDDDLLRPVLRSDLRLDLRARDERRAALDAITRADAEDFAERHLVADVAGELLDPELVAGGHPVLLAACLDHRVHAPPSSEPPRGASPGCGGEKRTIP